ncbi:MAB_1171c family putative transporter [Streptomyces sp. SUK 48]|uniref:MAB_1171c family putative transporter n=1 Tax=Streptomyces sp. SUK 48 TaxID=2582831 RepID=UPI00129AF4AF|nr:MAB_1171c family putative transporter [Streptomyces sp. SUK 48]
MSTLALDPSVLLGRLYISFWIPAALLTVALLLKLPTIIRLWRDPLLRAVGGMLLFACTVFVFCVPSMIHRMNVLTGVPNFAAPWCYSLITANSGAGLLFIVTWRNGRAGRAGRPARARRATWWIGSGYTLVVAALWVLFLLADVPVERVRDLDTYYARTPFMREEILLYLLAHTVACALSSRVIWDWVRDRGLDAWLRWGLRLLGGGYALSLLYDAAKVTAVVARWTGRDPDWLSTNLAPPVASLSAILLAAGFILPHAGQALHDRYRLRRAYRGLGPLYRVLRSATGAGPRFSLRATAELRLIRRETYIRDALLPLARHLDTGLTDRAYAAAIALGHPAARARAVSAAVGVLGAIENGGRPVPGDADPTVLLRDIAAISAALRRPADVAAVRALAAAAPAPPSITVPE